MPARRILFIDIDTMRPDHLGCYGYVRDTSPNIDQLAQEGIRFNEYYCSDAPCLPSRTALMTGMHGIKTGVVGHGGTAADMRLEGPSRGFRQKLADENLPGMLRSSGFRTATISPFAERHSAWGFYAGFDEIYNTGKMGGETADDITPAVLDWLRRNGKSENWFLHVNYWDPHTPYRAPPGFGNPFAKAPLPEWITEDVIGRQRDMAGPHKPREVSGYNNREKPEFPRHAGEIRNLKDLRRVIDGYDCGIRYADEHVGRILGNLRRAGVYDDTAVIISSDHGENMGELGIYGEHGTADYATCRIPMIIKWPGSEPGRISAGLHYNLDLLPTLAELAGAENFPSRDGKSYAGAINSGGDNGRDYLVLGQCAHVCQRSVRFREWLYIRTYHDGYHLFPEEMLFNVREDPHEQKNLAEAEGGICGEAARKYLSWHDRMMSEIPSGTDPMRTVLREGGPHHAKGRLKDYCEYLAGTGRTPAAEELKKRHPGEFAGPRTPRER